MKLFNSTLHTESKKHREMRLAGLLPKKVYKLAKASKKASSDWNKARKGCLELYGNKCFICGRSDLPIHIHHWQYTRTQRPDLKYDINNLIPLCALHHNHNGADKRFYDLQELIKKLKGQ